MSLSRIYPEPDEFNPDHFLSDIPSVYYMPFGEGPRVCVAMRFALLQVKLTIVRILQHYRIRLAADYEVRRNLIWCFPFLLRNEQTNLSVSDVNLFHRHDYMNDYETFSLLVYCRSIAIYPSSIQVFYDVLQHYT